MLSLFTTLTHFTIDLPRRIEEGGEDTEAFTLSDLSSQGKSETSFRISTTGVKKSKGGIEK